MSDMTHHAATPRQSRKRRRFATTICWSVCAVAAVGFDLSHGFVVSSSRETRVLPQLPLAKDNGGEGSSKNNNTVNSLAPLTTKQAKEIVLQKPVETKRQMDLMWCSNDYCKDVVRERVVGKHNQILLTGPATGQVAYTWSEEGEATSVCSVLLLVKPGDDELMKILANAVHELTQLGNIQILLDPTTAARLEYNHGVRGRDHIRLFEVTPTPGFGDNLLGDFQEADSQMGLWPADVPTPGENEIAPDLICTLGGDGLVMHAAMIFQGPTPPILCVSGGSLGFNTPFRPDEMVEAIRISLGLLRGEDGDGNSTPTFDNGDIDVFPPNMPTYPYESMQTSRSTALSHKSKLSFGLGGRVCLSIRMRLECRILNRQGIVKARYNVLNEVVIDRGSSPYLAALECFCDDVHLTTVQADGVIFATPTGSTAYSLAAGSSVVHPAVPCILLTPICPHVLSFRSMVFPDHVVLQCYVPDDARSTASVAFDGKHRQELQRGDAVQIQASPYPVPTINRVDHSADWLGSLKRSFNFNARPRQKPL